MDDLRHAISATVAIPAALAVVSMQLCNVTYLVKLSIIATIYINPSSSRGNDPTVSIHNSYIGFEPLET
jgi:hypothetical protein